jgi:hypothetical protein
MAASSVLEVEEDLAKDLCKQLGVTAAKKATGAKLGTLLKKAVDNAEEDGEIDLTKAMRKNFDAIHKAKKIKVVSGEEEEEEEDDDDEEEETASRNGKAKKGKAKKKAAKKSSGPTSKDQIFDLWVKYSEDPSKARKVAHDKFDDTISANTINRWMSRWNGAEGPDDEVGFPRGAKGRDKEIKSALKDIRAALKESKAEAKKAKAKGGKKKSKKSDDDDED